MKKRLRILAMLLFVLTVALLFPHSNFPSWDRPDILSRSQSRRIQTELALAMDICHGAKDRDSMEADLIKAGVATVDTDAIYPAYLANSDGLRNFAAGTQADTSVFQVTEEGSCFHLFFSKGKEDFLLLTKLSPHSQTAESEILPLYEAVLAPWDMFYYRCYPANDPHYIDYNAFRLIPADRNHYDLMLKYISPIGYRFVNLFLTDWQEGDWENFSLNDTFEYLYALQNGEPFPWQAYAADDSGYLQIPSALFENTLLPFFSISREELRAAAWYKEETDTYPWRPVHGDDLTAWELPVYFSEITACTQKPDGTITLTVQVASPEKMTNNLFSHEVTIRPLNNGSFQYAGNRVTYVNQWGLPPTMERFELDKKRTG